MIEEADGEHWPAWSIDLIAGIRTIVQDCARARLFSGEPIKDPAALNAYLMTELAGRPQEEAWGIFLDSDLRPVKQSCFAVGHFRSAPIEPRQVIRAGLIANAAGLILVHNHPGGNQHFSMSDIAITRLLMDCLNSVGIVLHEHILVTRAGTCSLRQSNPELWPS
ncbi:JAB domain-containing protein [Sphingomonas sp. CJ99]